MLKERRPTFNVSIPLLRSIVPVCQNPVGSLRKRSQAVQLSAFDLSVKAIDLSKLCPFKYQRQQAFVLSYPLLLVKQRSETPRRFQDQEIMEELAIMDQLPFAHFYSQMIVCFPLAGTTDNSEILAHLEDGLRSLIRVFPFLNKQVVLELDAGSLVTTSGIHKLAPRDNGDELMLRVNEVAGQFPSYEQISRSRAPASMLNSSVLAPMKSIPDLCDFSAPQPVLVIQANLVNGGLLLCFAAMHNVLDGNALGQLIRHFATACRGEIISDADIKAGNLARHNLFPPLRPGEPSQDHSDIHKKLDPSHKKPVGAIQSRGYILVSAQPN